MHLMSHPVGRLRIITDNRFDIMFVVKCCASLYMCTQYIHTRVSTKTFDVCVCVMGLISSSKCTVNVLGALLPDSYTEHSFLVKSLQHLYSN